jgi:predicted nuclease with TOPRIM domain
MSIFKRISAKAALREQLLEAQLELRELYDENEDLRDENEGLWVRIKKEEESAEEWRNKYELLYLTPEIKADTEAAFNRGVRHAKLQMSAWFLDEARKMEYGVTDTEDKGK